MHGNIFFIIVFFSVRRPSPEPGKLWLVCEIVIHSWNRRPVVLHLVTLLVLWSYVKFKYLRFWMRCLNWMVLFGRSLVTRMFWLGTRVWCVHLPPVPSSLSQLPPLCRSGLLLCCATDLLWSCAALLIFPSFSCSWNCNIWCGVIRSSSSGRTPSGKGDRSARRRSDKWPYCPHILSLLGWNAGKAGNYAKVTGERAFQRLHE